LAAPELEEAAGAAAVQLRVETERGKPPREARGERRESVRGLLSDRERADVASPSSNVGELLLVDRVGESRERLDIGVRREEAAGK